MDALPQPAVRLIVDRYEVVRVLGEGSAARTLLCRDREADRDVALKELRVEHLEDWKHLELFQREAHVLGGLRHHAIPEIYASFEATDDRGRTQLYLVQEFVQGISLAQRLEDGPSLGQVELIQLSLGVLDVLEYLHGRSPPVYHRDIKPSNIVVRPTSAPVLVDFGSVTRGWRPTKEQGSTVTGTFGYMPPEQLLGQVGPTSDLYALGATLLHVLTGRPPTDFPFDSGRIEVPEDLPAPPGLRRLVEALLEPAPNKRPRSVADARQILLSDTTAPKSTALVPLSSGPPAVVSGDGPRPIDVGPPPRDPKGEFADVYRLLTDPFNPIPVAESPATRVAYRALGIFGALFASVATFGILPVIYLTDRRKRRNKYRAIFCEGERTDGVLVHVNGNPNAGMYASLGYEFMVGDTKFRSFIDLPVAFLKYCAVGDAVKVLYDEQDPSRSCLAFRHRPGNPFFK